MRNKTGVGLAVVFAAISVIAVVFFANHMEKNTAGSLRQNMQSLAETTALGVGPMLSSERIENIAVALRSARMHDHVEFVSLQDQAGRLVASFDRYDALTTGYRPDIHSHVVDVPVVQDGVEVGRLSIGYSPNRLESFNNMLVLLSLFIFGAGILAGIGVRGMVSKSTNESVGSKDKNNEAAGVASRLADKILSQKAEELEKEVSVRREMEDRLLVAMEVAEAANTAKSEFLASISHELRTPMTAIMSSSQLLMEYLEDSHEREILEIITISSNSMMTLINDLLFFAKTEAGQVSLEDQVFELRKSVADTLKPFTIKAKEKGLELNYSIEQTVPETLVGDVSRLRQILSVLIDNALKFTSEGTIDCHVKIESMGQTRGAKGSSIYMHCSVRDTGIGIDPEKHNEIFEAFTQADGSTTREFGGSGLGLAIARQLVELMDGRIWVESVPGKGSTFHFVVHMGLSEAVVEGQV